MADAIQCPKHPSRHDSVLACEHVGGDPDTDARVNVHIQLDGVETGTWCLCPACAAGCGVNDGDAVKMEAFFDRLDRLDAWAGPRCAACMSEGVVTRLEGAN